MLYFVQLNNVNIIVTITAGLQRKDIVVGSMKTIICLPHSELNLMCVTFGGVYFSIGLRRVNMTEHQTSSLTVGLVSSGFSPSVLIPFPFADGGAVGVSATAAVLVFLRFVGPCDSLSLLSGYIPSGLKESSTCTVLQGSCRCFLLLRQYVLV